MITEAGLTALTKEIMGMGYDEATASHFAVLLGDTPLSDQAGNYIVMDGGKQLAILPPLAFFQEPD